MKHQPPPVTEREDITPRVGVRIETGRRPQRRLLVGITPRVGVRIETLRRTAAA